MSLRKPTFGSQDEIERVWIRLVVCLYGRVFDGTF